VSQVPASLVTIRAGDVTDGVGDALREVMALTTGWVAVTVTVALGPGAREVQAPIEPTAPNPIRPRVHHRRNRAPASTRQQ
jgi:hypothetical protein